MSECDREASIMRRLWPSGAAAPQKSCLLNIVTPLIERKIRKFGL